MSQLRALAESRGSHWLQDHVSGLLGDMGAGAASPAQPISRPRRTRPPERLSPEASPRVQGSRTRSPVVDPPGRAAGRAAPARRARPGRNPAMQRNPQRGGDPPPAVTPRVPDGSGPGSAAAECREAARRFDDDDRRGGAVLDLPAGSRPSHVSGQSLAGPASTALHVSSAVPGGPEAGGSGTPQRDGAVEPPAPPRSEVRQQESGSAAAGFTAPRQPGESPSMSVSPLSLSQGGVGLGPQGEVGRGIVDIISGLAEWVAVLRQSSAAPSPAATRRRIRFVLVILRRGRFMYALRGPLGPI